MKVEIRAARASEMEEFQRLTSYVFAGPPPDAPERPPETVLPEWTTCAFVDGRMAVSTAAFPFVIRLNGGKVGAAGLTAVGSYPEFRRQGLLRRTMLQGLGEQRERGQSIAILWASFAGIYQRYGYGLASKQVQYRFDPRLVPYRDERSPSGSVGLVDKAEALALVDPIYRRHSRGRNLYLFRVPIYWEAGILNVVENRPPYIAVYRDDSGEPQGYLVYRVKADEGVTEPGPAMNMDVRDFVALTPEAHHALWAYIRRHDLVRWVSMVAPLDDPTPDLLLDPRELRMTLGDGIWLRVVDIEKALPQRLYGGAGALTLEIDDPVCDWNAGRFALETDGEKSEVKRTDRAPDLRMPVRTLASLLAGQASASRLQRAGLLEADDPAAVRLADRLFATDYVPFCPDGF